MNSGKGKKTLVVINDMSGNSEFVDVDLLKHVCAKNDIVDEIHIEFPEQEYETEGYDKLIVCGGDGTMNNAINKCKNQEIDIFYFPYGTLNERANTTGTTEESSARRLQCMGMANKNLFSYVIASGAFTEIGYTAKSKLKKRIKWMAYILKVVSAYRVHHIKAEIVTDKVGVNGTFSLIMVIDSNRCFGFNFNKAYHRDNKIMHLLTIRSTGKNNIIGKIRMFFPFFRTFFVGFKKEYHSKNIDFMEVKNVEINLDGKYDFCVDGEKREYEGFLHVEKLNIKPRLFIMQRR